jgi:hypothetical protein
VNDWKRERPLRLIGCTRLGTVRKGHTVALCFKFIDEARAMKFQELLERDIAEGDMMIELRRIELAQ